MKRLRYGLLFVLVAALAINLPAFAAPPTKAFSPTMIGETKTAPGFNFGDVAKNDLAVFIGPDGNLNVIDRSFTELPGRDVAFDAFMALESRFPGLTQQWANKVAAPTFGAYSGPISVPMMSKANRASQDSLRSLAQRDLKPLLEAVSTPDLKAPAWYEPGPTIQSGWASVVCSPCGRGETPAKSCGSLCATDCAGRAGTCVKIIVHDGFNYDPS
jgi:hypothetical protein